MDGYDNINTIYRERSKSSIKAIVVEWGSIKLKQQFRILSSQNKDVLKASNLNNQICKIFITDYLPKHKRALLHATKQLLQADPLNYKYVWAYDGTILAKKDDTSKIFEITSTADLDKHNN